MKLFAIVIIYLFAFVGCTPVSDRSDSVCSVCSVCPVCTECTVIVVDTPEGVTTISGPGAEWLLETGFPIID